MLDILKNAKETCEYLEISNQTLKRMIKKEEITVYKKDGEIKKNYFKLDELEQIKLNRQKDIMNNEKLTERLIDLFGYMPYELLEEYISIHIKIKVKCLKCNNILDLTPGNMLHSQQNKKKKNIIPVCKYCNSGKNQFHKEEEKVIFKTKEDYQVELDELFKYDYSYEVLEEYIDSDTKIKHKCLKCNYEFSCTPKSIKYSKTKLNRRVCPSCNNMIHDTRPYNVRLNESNPNIIALENYINLETEIKHKCLKCNNIWDSKPSNRLHGEGCPKCNNIIQESKMEREIQQFLEDNNINYITKDRKVLNGQELDIIITDHNIAIECNGLHWHSDKFKDKNYHLNKTNNCKEEGIRLIHIFENEWNDIQKQEILKNKILYITNNKNNQKIYARKCYIEEIDKDYKKEFLNFNHIQGNDSSSIKLGLWYPTTEGDILVALMTFCKPRKALGQKSNSEYDYELSRFATEKDYNVIGAFGKLFKYFKLNYEWHKIITYADKRYSEGNLYFNNNFIYLRDSKPNYFYYNRNKKELLHRYSFRKQELRKKFPELYDESLTEFEIMDKTKIYSRIWDCGNMVFEFKK